MPMFVQDFQVIEAPFSSVAARVEAGVAPLIVAALEDARTEGARLFARVKPAGWPQLLAKTVEVRAGVPRSHGDGIVVSFAWAASGGASSLFPTLEADLELAPFGDHHTEVILRGNYRPPGGALGRRLDQVLLYRLAASTVRGVLQSLCAALVREVREGRSVA